MRKNAIAKHSENKQTKLNKVCIGTKHIPSEKM